MKLTQLDDETPPEPDDALLAQVRQRSARLRARQRRRMTAVIAAAAVVVAGAVGVVWHDAGTTRPRLAVSGPAPAKVPGAALSIVGSWTPRFVAGYARPARNFRWVEAPFLRFDSKDQWSGSDGCNSMGGSYRLQPDGTFQTSGLTQTLIRCSPPVFPTVAVLHSTTHVARQANQLTFLDINGNTIATYDRILNKSESPQWAAAGNDIRKNGGSPYLSQPVNITGPGRYTLVFGPLRPADILRFDQLRHPTGIGVSFPNDVTFEGQPDLTGVKTFVRDGATYLRVPFVVATFRSEYDGLRVWVQ
jgi:META domain